MNVVNINLWAVLLGAIASMVIGAVYYSPYVFEKQWMKLGKVDSKRFIKERPKLMPVVFVGAFLVSFMIAYVAFLYHAFFQDSWILDSTASAVLVCVGFSASTIVVHGALDQRPRQLLYLTLGNRFLTYAAIGAIVGWLHP